MATHRHQKVSLLLTFLLLTAASSPSCRADDSSAPQMLNQQFSDDYTKVTKAILLKSVELERFSLNYRLEHSSISNLQRLVFIGTQEAGAAGGLAFEVSALEQFNRGRKRLLSFRKDPVDRGLCAAETTSIIAASGSAFALGVNALHAFRACRHGFDAKGANRYVESHLKEIDSLLAQREALVEANKQSPAYERAKIEGKILHSMRSAFVNEYSTFRANTASAFTAQNLFFLQNIAYNTLGAVGAGLGRKALNEPKLNGPSNIVFTISGAMAMAAPLLCSAQLHGQRKYMLKKHREKFGYSEADLAELSTQCKLLDSTGGDQGSLIPALSSTKRMAMYSDSTKRFVGQLENEAQTMDRLNKVALQTSIMGPAIGSLLMTQGILGTRGYYRFFPDRPRKQLDLSYKGAVCGTVGTSMALVGNAAFLLASLSYEHHLRKNHRLPAQMIRERLTHLDEIEKTVSAL